MAQLAEYWRDVKDHSRKAKNAREEKYKETLLFLSQHHECKEVGNQRRIRDWDFWHTGKVRNIKTGEQITLLKLKQLLEELYEN